MEKPVVGNVPLQNEPKNDLMRNNGTGFNLMSRGRTPDGSKGSESTLNTSASIQADKGDEETNEPRGPGCLDSCRRLGQRTGEGPHARARNIAESEEAHSTFCSQGHA